MSPGAVTHDLADRHDHLTIGPLLYVLRLDERIDQVKLAPPILTDLLVAVQASALHPVRPIDVHVHRREGAVDVARAERLVGATQQLLVRITHDGGACAVTAHTRCGIESWFLG
jgi:hypothetical protein